MSRFKLFLLGSPRLERNGGRVEVERRTVMALLAYLVVTGQPHSRDTLAALLWPETDEPHARGALRRDISGLNKILGRERLVVEGQTISLQRSANLWVDVEQFQARLALCRAHGHSPTEVCLACRAPLTEAVAFYQDDFLAGFSLRDSPDFEEWQLFETESLRRELAGALERLVRNHSTQGDAGREPALSYARRWLSLDPLHEPVQRALMQLYAWSGQRNAALRQYGECVRILERELGVSPEAATTQLYEAIKENQAPPPAADPHLPPRSEKPGRHDHLFYAPGQSAHRGLDPATGHRPIASGVEPEPALLEPPFSPLDRIVRGRLVGRERELAQASAVWQQATSTPGEESVLLISGEPGIGKTRLARELVALVESAGGKALVGECYAEGGPPYAPLAQMLRASLGGPDATRIDLSLPNYALADLMTLAPDLRSRYPEVPANLSLDPLAEQQRLFESIVVWCEALTQATRTPLLLFVEDAHWADSGTLFLLRHLARRSRLAKLRLLLVMTYREAELDAAQALAEVLLALNRERLAAHLTLARLNREQTRDLLAVMLVSGGEISPEFLDGVYQETEGNPFFIEEVCKVLIDAGKLYYAGGYWRRTDMETIDLPQSVKAAILSRLERLPPPVQATLRLAAVLGREFDFDTLYSASEPTPSTLPPSEVTEQVEEVLMATLERAEQAQLIGEIRRAGRVRFAFVHALIPFTLRESLSGLRLQRLHRRAAQAIEHLRPDDVEALAYHFSAAGEREKAVVYSHQAAQRAEALYAYDEALQHLHTVLNLLEAGEQIEMQLAALEQLADVHCLLGAYREAIPIYQQALDLWRNLTGADKWAAVRLQRKIGETVSGAEWYHEPDAQKFKATARAALMVGLNLTEGEPPHPERVRLLTMLSHDAWRHRVSSDWDTAEQYARAAVDLAEQLAAPVELSAALNALAVVYVARGLFRQRVDVALRRVALSHDPRFGDRREYVHILNETSVALIDVGEYGPALPYLLEAESLGGQIQAVEEVINALRLQGRRGFYLDRWDDVLAMEEKLQSLKQRYPPERLGATCFHRALHVCVYALRGEFERAGDWPNESLALMAPTGPPEHWPRSIHY